MRLPISKTAVLGVLAVLWLAAVAGLMIDAGRYRATPGEPGAPPAEWPSGVAGQAPGTTTIVMLAHPRCPCTRASLSELNRLMTEVGDRARATVLFVRPPGVASGWELTDTWEAAQRIPNTTVEVDEQGRRAAQLGALTSGQVVAYDAAGQLVFSGGITAARGHAGDNAGHTALRQLILAGQHNAAVGPVFGCPLNEPHRPEGGGA